jgi:5-formyltetrahydrofolate cyclo-ligase
MAAASTIAPLPPCRTARGVGFELGRLKTIHPQAHDVPMDRIVTEAGLVDVAERGP